MSFTGNKNWFFEHPPQLTHAESVKHENDVVIESSEKYPISEAGEYALVPDSNFAANRNVLGRVNPSVELLRRLRTVLDPHFHGFTLKVVI